MRAKSILVVWLTLSMIPGQVLAWGDTGHRTIGETAMQALPVQLPAFLRTKHAITDVGEYSREPDLWRGSGTIHDADRDPAHFIALDDDGKTLAGVGLDALPQTRSQFEALLRAKGIDPAKGGYLPYSTADAYEQVVKDMAYWRVISLAISRETRPRMHMWLKGARLRREDLLLRDIGILSHYAGDATQPMHLSIHSNGWGEFPNPKGFTTAPIHWPIEGAYVRLHVAHRDVQKQMVVYQACSDAPELCIQRRLLRNFTQIVPLYTLEKAGGFKNKDPRGPIYLAGLIARGASDLRDMIVDAWGSSNSIGVGHGQITYDMALHAKSVNLTEVIFGES